MPAKHEFTALVADCGIEHEFIKRERAGGGETMLVPAARGGSMRLLTKGEFDFDASLRGRVVHVTIQTVDN